MDDIRKGQRWGGQRRLSRRRMLTMTKMTWDGTAFFVLIKLRLYGRVCNALIIFIDPPSLSPFSPSGFVAVNVAVPCSSARAATKDNAMSAAGVASRKGATV